MYKTRFAAMPGPIPEFAKAQPAYASRTLAGVSLAPLPYNPRDTMLLFLKMLSAPFMSALGAAASTLPLLLGMYIKCSLPWLLLVPLAVGRVASL